MNIQLTQCHSIDHVIRELVLPLFGDHLRKKKEILTFLSAVKRGGPACNIAAALSICLVNDVVNICVVLPTETVL